MRAGDELTFIVEGPKEPRVCDFIKIKIQYYKNLETLATDEPLNNIQKRALHLFEQANDLDEGSASLWQIENTSLGIEGWSKYDL